MMAGGIGEFEVRPAPLVSLETQPAPRLRCCSAADRRAPLDNRQKDVEREHARHLLRVLLLLMDDDE